MHGLLHRARYSVFSNAGGELQLSSLHRVSKTMSAWDEWLEEAVTGLQSKHLLRSLRPITAQRAPPPPPTASSSSSSCSCVSSTHVSPPASSVHVRLSASTLAAWLEDEPSTGGPADNDLSVSYSHEVSAPGDAEGGSPGVGQAAVRSPG